MPYFTLLIDAAFESFTALFLKKKQTNNLVTKCCETKLYCETSSKENTPECWGKVGGCFGLCCYCLESSKTILFLSSFIEAEKEIARLSSLNQVK